MNEPQKIDWTLAKDAIAARMGGKGLTDIQWRQFQHVAESKGLDPLQSQIMPTLHFNKRTNQHDMAIITQIDGYRLIADRTGKYAGSDNPVLAFSVTKGDLVSAAVTVYKMVDGQRCPFAATAQWAEYSGGSPMWGKMPCLMLSKCAEALALRKAFPAELSGVYTDAEMDQARTNDGPPEDCAPRTDTQPPMTGGKPAPAKPTLTLKQANADVFTTKLANALAKGQDAEYVLMKLRAVRTVPPDVETFIRNFMAPELADAEA